MRKQQQQKFSQGLVDFLLERVPGLREHLPYKNIVDSGAAGTLFSIWRDKKNVISSNALKKPENMASKDVDLMQKEGLIRNVGNMLEITTKGKTVIRMLILGDERSSFEDDGSYLDINTAAAVIRSTTIKKSSKKEENKWWDRFERR